MSNIGLRIKQRREELKLTQDDLAKLMGYTSKSTINKVEKGINDVTQSNILKYAKVLDCSLSYLLDWEEYDNYSERTAELLVMLRKSPKIMQLAKDFIELTPAQQETVLALVHSMIPGTHPQQ
jgi:transcriptional regulator with XRE-family HTH domain